MPRMLNSAVRAFAVLAALAIACAAPARAEWPERPITIIVPFPPGGPNDLLGRLLAAELGKKFNQTVIVENKAGAVGDIGITAGARAAPDGYTLVEVTGVVLINPSVRKTAYDPVKDFAPVAYLGAAPNAIITRPATGINSVADLIKKAKENPGKLTYATAGTGSVSQLAVELLKIRADISMTHVPFQGAAPAIAAVSAGTVQAFIVPLSVAKPQAAGGKVKLLAVTSERREAAAPGVPTAKEEGVPVVISGWHVLAVPAGTPADVMQRLNQALNAANAKPQVKAQLLKAGVQPATSSIQEAQAMVKDEYGRWGEVARKAGLQPQ